MYINNNILYSSMYNNLLNASAYILFTIYRVQCTVRNPMFFFMFILKVPRRMQLCVWRVVHNTLFINNKHMCIGYIVFIIFLDWTNGAKMRFTSNLYIIFRFPRCGCYSINMDSLNNKCVGINMKGDTAAQLNEKQNFYNPYQHRDVKHPTTWVQQWRTLS